MDIDCPGSGTVYGWIIHPSPLSLVSFSPLSSRTQWHQHPQQQRPQQQRPQLVSFRNIPNGWQGRTTPLASYMDGGRGTTTRCHPRHCRRCHRRLSSSVLWATRPLPNPLPVSRRHVEQGQPEPQDTHCCCYGPLSYRSPPWMSNKLLRVRNVNNNTNHKTQPSLPPPNLMMVEEKEQQQHKGNHSNSNCNRTSHNNNNNKTIVRDSNESNYNHYNQHHRRNHNNINNHNNNNNNNNNNKLDLNLIVLDHYDSFTYNLVDFLGQICQKPPRVLAADCATTWVELRRRMQQQQQPRQGHQKDNNDNNNDDDSDDWRVDGIVLSPGPGHPNDEICQLSKSVILDNPTIPILGVCLGYQILGIVYGAHCIPAPQPVHGQVQSMELVMSLPSSSSSQQQEQQQQEQLQQNDNDNDDNDDEEEDDHHVETKLAWPSLWEPWITEDRTKNGTTTTTTTLSLLPELNVTRYHSLHVVWPNRNTTKNKSHNHNTTTTTTSQSLSLDKTTLPIVPTARISSRMASSSSSSTTTESDHNDDNAVVMALQHMDNPHYGVQFHPESIGSQPQGRELLQQFCQICHQRKQQQQRHEQQPRPPNNGEFQIQQTQKERKEEEEEEPVWFNQVVTRVGNNRQPPAETTNSPLETATRTRTLGDDDDDVSNNDERWTRNTKRRTAATTTTTTTREVHDGGGGDDDDDDATRYKVYIHKVGPTHRHLRPEHVMQEIVLLQSDEGSNDNNNKDEEENDHEELLLLQQHRNEPSRHSFWLDEASFEERCISRGQLPPDEHSSHHNEINNNQTTMTSTTTTSSHATTSRKTISILGRFGPQQRRVEYWGPEKPHSQQGLHEWWWQSYDNNDNNNNKQTSSQGYVAHRHDPSRDIMQYLQSRHACPTQHVQLVTWTEDDDEDDTKQEPLTRKKHDAELQHINSKESSVEPLWYKVKELNESQAMHVLPFAYRGGHVGYLGYEVRHVTERHWTGHDKHKDIESSVHTMTGGGEGGGGNPSSPQGDRRDSQSSDQIPTAAFGFADQSFVYHHETQDWYLVGVVTTTTTTTTTTENERDGENDILSDNTQQSDETKLLRWMHETSLQMMTWEPVDSEQEERPPKDDDDSDQDVVEFRPNRSRETYDRNFDQCLQHIQDGESYELCLTNQLEANVVVPQLLPQSTQQRGGLGTSSPLDLYHILRQQNPAPFSAFFDWNGRGQGVRASQSFSQNEKTGSALSICCSSPERFLSVLPVVNDDDTDDSCGWNGNKFQVEAKPIKGTVARILAPENANEKERARMAKLDQVQAQTLRSSEKDRAENLMIVDLLRNDLSRVCQVGTVHVAKLMDIETYATVHQMVSTIRGSFALDNSQTHEVSSSSSSSSTVDVLTACFPGGSMTGAPKIRTMELLNELEEGVSRGPYSGALGYVSVNGAIDMNKVIRTAVLTPYNVESQQGDHGGDKSFGWNVSVGAGGAITILSNKEDEYEEMILKASAVTRAIQTWARRANTHATRLSASSYNGTIKDEASSIRFMIHS